MRVLLISHTCQSPTEGQPKAEWLARMPGLDLRVLVPDRWKHYGKWRQASVANDSCGTYHVGRVACPWVGPAQFYLHWYPELAQLLREFQPDVIDLWEEPWGLVSAQACRLRRLLLPQAKIISETEQNIYKILPPPFESFRRYTLQQADYVVARSAEALDVTRRKGYGGPAQVIPNAVDTALFRPLNRLECRQSLNLAPNRFIAGYIGRLVEEKGLRDMVDALAFCPEHVNLLFVGEGPYQAALEQRARELGKTEQVRFLPRRPLEELPVVMNALDTLVLVSRTTGRWKEQFGRVLIEAHACRIPVIGSTSGAIPEVVGGGGLIVPEQNPRALADAMLQLAADPEPGSRLGEVGRGQVEQQYTWRQVAERMYAIYQIALQPSPAESRKEMIF